MIGFIIITCAIISHIGWVIKTYYRDQHAKKNYNKRTNTYYDSTGVARDLEDRWERPVQVGVDYSSRDLVVKELGTGKIIRNISDKERLEEFYKLKKDIAEGKHVDDYGNPLPIPETVGWGIDRHDSILNPSKYPGYWCRDFKTGRLFCSIKVNRINYYMDIQTEKLVRLTEKQRRYNKIYESKDRRKRDAAAITGNEYTGLSQIYKERYITETDAKTMIDKFNSKKRRLPQDKNEKIIDDGLVYRWMPNGENFDSIEKFLFKA